MVVPARTSAPAVFLGLSAHRKRGGHPMIGAGRAGRRFGRAGMQAAQNHGAGSRNGSSGFQLKGSAASSVPSVLGDPIAGSHAVRHEAADKAGLRRGRRLRQRRRGRNHRIQKRQRQRRRRCRCRTVRREMCFLVINIVAVFSYFQPLLTGRPLLVLRQPVFMFIWNGGALHDTQHDGRELVIARRPIRARWTAPAACPDTRRRGPARRSASSR